LALQSAIYGYCPIEVPPDIVNKGRCSDFGEGIVLYIRFELIAGRLML